MKEIVWGLLCCLLLPAAVGGYVSAPVVATTRQSFSLLGRPTLSNGFPSAFYWDSNTQLIVSSGKKGGMRAEAVNGSGVAWESTSPNCTALLNCSPCVCQVYCVTLAGNVSLINIPTGNAAWTVQLSALTSTYASDEQTGSLYVKTAASITAVSLQGVVQPLLTFCLQRRGAGLGAHERVDGG